MRRPPPINSSDPAGELYDTVVDVPSDPSIYVVFDNAQSYPEYCLELEYGTGDPAVSAGQAERQRQRQEQHQQIEKKKQMPAIALQLHVKYEAKNYAFQDERVQFIRHPKGGLGGILLCERRPCATPGGFRHREDEKSSGAEILEACPLFPLSSLDTMPGKK